VTNIEAGIAKTTDLLKAEECNSPSRHERPEPPAREHIRKSAQVKREQVLQSAQRVDVPNLGVEEDDDETRRERLRQIEQDMCRQQLDEMNRLREIEADRLRQEEEEFTAKSLRAAEIREGHAASTCAGDDDGADPELLRQQVERKLRDQRVREERRLRKLREHGSLPAARFASCSGQSNKGAVATSPTASWPRAGRPAPAPPARNFEAEAKVMSKIINMAVVPSQQERWRMRKGDEDDKTSEWERIKKMQEEQEEMQMRQMERDLHEAKPEPASMNTQASANTKQAEMGSGQHQFNLMEQEQEKAKQVAARPPLKTHISVEEQDRLDEWERLKRQEEEEQELFLRQQERELLGRRPAARGPPPRRHTSPAQMQSDGRAARGAARFARPCEQKRIEDWEEIRRREEEAAEMQLREMERQRQKEMEQKRVAEEKLKMQSAIERQWQEEQDAEHRRLLSQQQQQNQQSPQKPAPVQSPASPRPPPSPRTPDHPPPLSPRTQSSCVKSQELEWLEVKRLQDEAEERQRAEAEREIHKQRVAEEQSKKPSCGSLRGRGRKVRHLPIQEEEHDLELERLRDEEERERQRLATVEKRKREIDQELERERIHLETLAKLQNNFEGGVELEALEQAYAASGDTTRMLEMQRLKQLKALEAQKMQELSKLANGGHDGLKTDRVSSASEDDTCGFSEGCEDVSLGMDAPNQSGSTTPTPTSGELAEIDSRKSAKSSSDGDEERCSPKKVHFAEANEIKLLPREEPFVANENS
jgi:hypothetical protein